MYRLGDDPTLKYFTHTLDNERLNTILEESRLSISEENYYNLINSNSVESFTDQFIETFEHFIPSKLKNVLIDTSAWITFKKDIALHLYLNSYACNVINLENTPNVRTHSNTNKVKAKMNKLYNKYYSEIALGYYSTNTTNYNKYLKKVGNELELEYNELDKHGQKVKIPEPVSEYVAHQAINYRVRSSYRENKLNEVIIKEQVIADNLLFKLLREKHGYNQRYLLNVYLTERDYNTKLLDYLASIDLSTFIDSQSVEKVLSMGCLLPNIFNIPNLLTIFLTYRENFSNRYSSDGYGPITPIYQSSRTKEAIWIETVQGIILELAYFTFPILETLHLNLINHLPINNQVDLMTYELPKSIVLKQRFNSYRSLNRIHKPFKTKDKQQIEALLHINYLIQSCKSIISDTDITIENFIQQTYSLSLNILQQFTNNEVHKPKEKETYQPYDSNLFNLPFPNIKYWLAFKNEYAIADIDNDQQDYAKKVLLKHSEIEKTRHSYIFWLNQLVNKQYMYNKLI